MQLSGAAARGPAAGPDGWPGCANGAEGDLASLVERVANLTSALEASQHPLRAAAAVAAAPRSSFWAGALLTLLVVGLVAGLAAYRFRYSLRRLSKRHEQRAVLRQARRGACEQLLA